MKFISPGGWFSLEYPATWTEFEDSEGTFLFYNPNKWNGNFRISAFRIKGNAQQYVKQELKSSQKTASVRIGEWDCAYSTMDFEDEGTPYTTHFWVTGKSDVCIECSFTVAKGGNRLLAEEVIRSLKLRTGKEPMECIPIRLLEICEVNEAFEWVSSTIKKTLSKAFSGQEEDIEKLQALVTSGKLKDQPTTWESIGLALGVIMENEMDGMEWVTVIDGNKEYPALRFRDLLVNPAQSISSCVKQKQALDLKAEFDNVKSEVEKRL
jgi:hypothetical protein